MVIAFAIILSPIVWLFVLAIRTRERPAPTRAECSEHLRTTQWCFVPERALTSARDTCRATFDECLDVRAEYAEHTPHAWPIECRQTPELWSVSYLHPTEDPMLRRHWTPDRETCEAYRVMLTRTYPSSSPGSCVDTNEARIASCLDVIRAYEGRVRSR